MTWRRKPGPSGPSGTPITDALEQYVAANPQPTRRFTETLLIRGDTVHVGDVIQIPANPMSGSTSFSVLPRWERITEEQLAALVPDELYRIQVAGPWLYEAQS